MNYKPEFKLIQFIGALYLALMAVIAIIALR